MFTLEESALLRRMLHVTEWVAGGVVLGVVAYFAPALLRRMPQVMAWVGGGLLLGAAGYFTLF